MREYIEIISHMETLEGEWIPDPEPRDVLLESRLGDYMERTFWITADGREANERALHESAGAAANIVVETSDDSFSASWNDPTQAALECLTDIVQTSGDYSVYYLGEMILPSRIHAAAALRSLARNC